VVVDVVEVVDEFVFDTEFDEEAGTELAPGVVP
jgi:hypothetical protein